MNALLGRYSLALILDIIIAGSLYVLSKSANDVGFLLIFITFPFLIIVFPMFLLSKLRIELETSTTTTKISSPNSIDMNETRVAYIEKE